MLVASVVLLCGCSTSTEIDKLMIVSGLSIDGDEEYRITSQIVNLQNASQNNLSPILLETNGKTVADAMASLSQLEGQKLYFTHAQVILVSEQKLKDGEAAHLIDLLNMAPRFRSSIRLAASVGSAKDVLATEPHTDPISAFSIRDSISESHRMLKAPDVPFYVFLNDTLESGIDGMLPLLSVDESGDIPLPYVCGTALFKDTVMVGSLTSEETKYLLLIKEKVSNAIYTTETHSFLINRGKSNIKYKDGNIVITVKLELSLIEGENLGNTVLKNMVVSDMQNGVSALLDKLKTLGCDPIGIGRCIKRTDSDHLTELYSDQSGDIYTKLTIDTDVKVSIVPSPKLAGKDD